MILKAVIIIIAYSKPGVKKFRHVCFPRDFVKTNFYNETFMYKLFRKKYYRKVKKSESWRFGAFKKDQNLCNSFLVHAFFVPGKLSVCLNIFFLIKFSCKAETWKEIFFFFFLLFYLAHSVSSEFLI